MHIRRSLFYVSVSFAVLGGCGNSDPSSGPSVRQSEARDPCLLLSEETLRRRFDVPVTTEITRELSKYTPHPHCTATWRKPDAEEIERRQAEAMQEYLRQRMRGEEATLPAENSSNRVALTLFGEPRSDSVAARESFDGAMRVLADGYTGEHEGVELTFQADLTPVEGVGQRAMWAARMHQLSVLADSGQIFHLVVETGQNGNAELEAAKAVATGLNQAL